jgi:hypothetical protein
VISILEYSVRSASPAGPRVTLWMSFGRGSNLPESNVATNEPDRFEPSIGCQSDSNEEVDCEAPRMLRMKHAANWPGATG